MKNFKPSKEFVAVFAGLCMVAAFGLVLKAKDPTAINAGVVREVFISRFNVKRFATTAQQVATSSTNVLQAFAGMVGKLIIVPGSTNDVIELHDTAASNTCTAANETFMYSPSNLTSIVALGLPQIIDLTPGWDHQTGITIVITPGSTNVPVRTYTQIDITGPR